MLFNSFEFILIFLPLTILVFFKLGSLGKHRIALWWLMGASLFFYGWWDAAYLVLIVGSILFNYALGIALGTVNQRPQKKWMLIFGIVVNLGLLGYFKYANFFVSNINFIVDGNFHYASILLPLAISFFTFQQIAYIVGVYQDKAFEHNFLNYCLFITFFPKLIAGPIVHYRDLMPQFAKKGIYNFSSLHFTVGLSFFFMGLFKKVLIADSISLYTTPVFHAAEQGMRLTFFEAWLGALAYTLQIYFDFSGYSDMAIGIARMFGIRLPLNFNSPYKAVNVIDFWHRWHITLSQFLRDHLYIPLEGNRRGEVRRYTNVLITMTLGGLWHGAGWTFVVWGAVHGFYLSINHLWHALRRYLGYDVSHTYWWGRGLSRLITFIAVMIAWVLFRAESLEGAKSIFFAMAGGNGILFSPHFVTLPAEWGEAVTLMMTLVLIVVAAPNTQQIMYRYMRNASMYARILSPYRFGFVQWRPTLFWASIMLFVTLRSLYSMAGSVVEFLYYQF